MQFAVGGILSPGLIELGQVCLQIAALHGKQRANDRKVSPVRLLESDNWVNSCQPARAGSARKFQQDGFSLIIESVCGREFGERSFVQKISEHATREDTAIVRSIIAMGSNLGLEVTAEGVETPAQRSFLAAQGCDDLQGYLFSRPLPARDFDAFLDAWASRVLQRASCAGARSAGPS